MKIYDKEMYVKQEAFKTTSLFILVFLIGFILGYWANSFSKSNIIENKPTNEIVQKQ